MVAWRTIGNFEDFYYIFLYYTTLVDVYDRNERHISNTFAARVCRLVYLIFFLLYQSVHKLHFYCCMHMRDRFVASNLSFSYMCIIRSCNTRAFVFDFYISIGNQSRVCVYYYYYYYYCGSFFFRSILIDHLLGLL